MCYGSVGNSILKNVGFQALTNDSNLECFSFGKNGLEGKFNIYGENEIES